MKWQYLRVQLKKTVCMIPGMLGMAVMLIAVIGMTAFCAVRLQQKEALQIDAAIAVVLEGDNAMTGLLLPYVEQMESVSAYCHFEQLDRQTAMESLETGKVVAVVILPEQLLEGILDGTNPSVEVYFQGKSGIEQFLFTRLLQSGEGLLNVAQAQIYGAYDTTKEYGRMEQLAEMEGAIDSYNLAFALDRMAVFHTISLSATGQMSLAEYYLAAALVWFFLLFGMALYPVMTPESASLRGQLARQGTGRIWQVFTRWLCGLVMMLLIALLMLVAGKTIVRLTPEKLLLVCLALMMITLYVTLLYRLGGRGSMGILLIFLTSTLMSYASGAIVPKALLPEQIRLLGEKLPTGYLIPVAGQLVSDTYRGQTGMVVAGLVGYMVFFALLLLVVEKAETLQSGRQ